MRGKIATLLVASTFVGPAAWAQQQPIAIVGATIIDGTDAPPISGGTMIIQNGKIVAVGARHKVDVPKDARKIDARGKYVIPGLIDTNVHISGFFQSELFALYAYGEQDPYAKYGYSLEGAQEALKYGVTTILDTYGPLLPLMEVRDRINRGEAVGPRLLVGGNIIGWGGPASASENGGKPPTPLQHAMNQWFVQGTGTDLTAMYPDDVVKAVNRYMDLGPDFIKIGTTSHDIFPPISLTFSAEVHKAIVDAAHARGLSVTVHSGSVEGHRLAVATGANIITHADLVNLEFRPSLLAEICKSNTYFAPFTNMNRTPDHKHLVDHLTREDAESVRAQQAVREARAKVDNADRDSTSRLPAALTNATTGAERHSMASALINQERLIEGGCKIVIGTDSTPMVPPGLTPDFLPFYSDMGTGTLSAIEGLVAAGMSPKEALISATRRGAEATYLIDKVGTLEAGKVADLVILDADPLKDIANIRKISDVMRDGVVIDRKALPTKPFIYRRDTGAE
nr:amidohydrolase family protein [uncultured Steroidobacter sp.]